MKATGLTLLTVLLLPVLAMAHTTVIFPAADENGRKDLMVVHFVPWHGNNIMGIRLHAEDSPTVKGLESISMIHDGKERDISDLAVSRQYLVKNGRAECYSIPLSRKMISRAGDYVFVVKHMPHWKKNLGFYICKVSKFFMNRGGLVTDWPNRLFEDAPEIMPLSPPYSVYAGTLFRAEVVDNTGKNIAHARIHVEFLNYEAGRGGIDATSPILSQRDMGESVLYADSSGAFSFVPPVAGIWTFTLVDGDRDLMINGKKLQYDSSVSVAVKPMPEEAACFRKLKESCRQSRASSL